jgi:hypothetical protein
VLSGAVPAIWLKCVAEELVLGFPVLSVRNEIDVTSGVVVS